MGHDAHVAELQRGVVERLDLLIAYYETKLAAAVAVKEMYAAPPQAPVIDLTKFPGGELNANGEQCAGEGGAGKSGGNVPEGKIKRAGAPPHPYFKKFNRLTVAEREQRRRRVLEYLAAHGPCPIPQVAAGTGIPYGSTYNILVGTPHATDNGRGWVLTDSGRSYLALLAETTPPAADPPTSSPPAPLPDAS